MRVVAVPRCRRRGWMLAWALLAPSLVPLALFTYGPIGSVLWRSLQVRTFGRGTAFGVGNYAALWADERFWRALGNTAFYAAGTIVPSLVLALLFALALREAGWVTSVVRTLLVLPMMVPLVAAAALFTFIFLPGAGLIDHYLGWVGLGAVNWLGDPGLMMNEVEDNMVWLLSGLVMSNGGQYFNVDWGGEVFYDKPSTLGAVRFLDDLAHKYKVMPEGISDANAMTAAFFSGRAGMILNSTGALSFVRANMKAPYRVAFVPRAILNAVPIGGGSLVIPQGNSPERQAAAWTLIQWMTSPAIAGRWSRFTGYFAPNRGAYDLPEMKEYLETYPDARVALDQLQYARPWFATYQTVPVRKALGDPVQAMLAGRMKPADVVVAAQKAADALLAPYAAETALKVP